MVERGNDIHRRILSRITNLDADMLRWTEVLCNSPGSSAPPQSLRETINPYHSESDGEDEGEQGGTSGEYIQDPTMGGRIYLQDATTVVYRYASRMQSQGTTNRRLFEFEDIHKEFGIPRAHICSIDLPGTPINRVSGDALPSKAEARRSACFKACEKLYKLGLLDCQLVPLPYNLRAQHEYERNKNLEKDCFPEIKQSGTRSYRRKLPTFWKNILTAIPSVLYPTIVYTASPSEGPNSFGPIVILTREPLPSLHPFRLFFSGIPIYIHFQKALPIQVDETRIKDVHAYTVRICRTIMNKALVCDLEEAAYFFLPLPTDWRPSFENDMKIPDIVEIIPWDLVSLAGQHWAVPIKRTSADDLVTDLQDAIVQDRFIEFTRRYKVAKLRTDLTPLSKPTDSPVCLTIILNITLAYLFTQRESNYPNLFEFCKAKRKGLETLTNFDQPIIEVSKVQPILNHLNPTSKPPSSTSKSPTRCVSFNSACFSYSLCSKI
jgi:endoribonuclease Dicer